MLPWRAIPVTLAHWREPQIISSPSRCLLLAFFLMGSWSFLLFFSFFLFFFIFTVVCLSGSLTHSTHEQTCVAAILFCLISLFPTFLSFLIFFITIPSCSAPSRLPLYIPTPTRAFQWSSPHPPAPSEKEDEKRQTSRLYLL